MVRPGRGQAFHAAVGGRFLQDRDAGPVAAQQGIESDRSKPIHSRQHGPGIAFRGAGRTTGTYGKLRIGGRWVSADRS
jgi:hypothetical protein